MFVVPTSLLDLTNIAYQTKRQMDIVSLCTGKRMGLICLSYLTIQMIRIIKTGVAVDVLLQHINHFLIAYLRTAQIVKLSLFCTRILFQHGVLSRDWSGRFSHQEIRSYGHSTSH